MKNKASELSKKFGLKVKIERVKLGVSQEKLAEIANLNRITIGAIERGETSPTLDTINLLAKAFKINLCDILKFDF